MLGSATKSSRFFEKLSYDRHFLPFVIENDRVEEKVKMISVPLVLMSDSFEVDG